MDVPSPQVVVFGGPSLHPIQVGGERRDVVAGAGFVTALAARSRGVRVGLVARVPWALPPAVEAAFGAGWLDPGGLVPVEGALPAFRLTYGADEAAAYDDVSAGAEAGTVAGDLPRRWLGAGWVHVAPLGGQTGLQQAVVDGLRARGWSGRLSAGTYPNAVGSEPDAVRALAASCDTFFLNQAEATALWPAGGHPTGTRLVVTRGRAGLSIFAEGQVAEHAAPAVDVVDPTGAGDAIVGGWLAGEALAEDPVRAALSSARRVIGGWGAAALLGAKPPPHLLETPAGATAGAAPIAPEGPAALEGIGVDAAQVLRVGAALRESAARASLTFTGFPFPERDDPHAAELLALATLHQFGFWTASDTEWIGPMYAMAAGKRFKGSDFVWQAFTRAVGTDPTVLDPARLAAEPLLFDAICRDDDGRCPVPDISAHRALQQDWGAAMSACGGFGAVLAEARGSATPIRALLERLAVLPGFREDPLAKKAMLLVLILVARPEGLLPGTDRENIGPIVDYHLMRGCLRTGCVRVTDPDLRVRLEGREWVNASQESAVRLACRDALVALSEAADLGVAPIDGFFFANGRRACLETEAPRCGECALTEICAREEALFQPVFRTTAY
jgi:sugar/nucleoside kinase (ribokinase family)